MSRTLQTLLVLGLLLIGCAPVGEGQAMPHFHVIGHHGAPNDVPENTVPSFHAAMVAGANAMEADVCLTQDNVLVMFHDRDPDDDVALLRQAGGEGLTYIPDVPPIGSEWRRPVEELTLDELRTYYGYKKFAQSREPDVEIPTFDEFLTWARSEPDLQAVYLDFKLLPSQLDALLPLVSQLGSDTSLAGIKFYLLSVHSEIVVPLEAERAQLGLDSPRVVHDAEDPDGLELALGDGVRDVSIGFTPDTTWSGFLDETASAVSARKAGKVDSVIDWTIDRETQVAELLYYSVDGIITDDAAQVRSQWQATLR